MTIQKALQLIVAIFALPWAHAEILKDFDSLGGNKVLLEKAKVLEPDKKIFVVQNRIVDRNTRFELAPKYFSVFGGDSFLDTQAIGLESHFHINPKFSLGAGYFQAYNQLTAEGKSLVDNDGLIPDTDFLKSGLTGTLNWYPIYGKFNLLDLAIVHFDLYLLGGYGQVELSSGSTNAYTYGGGIGFWISQHLTSRVEVRQFLFEAQRQNGPVDMELTLGSLSLGYLL